MLYWSQHIFYLIGLYFGLILTIKKTLSLNVNYYRVLKYLGFAVGCSIILMIISNKLIYLLLNICFMLSIIRLGLKVNYKKLTIPFLICTSIYSIILNLASIFIGSVGLLELITNNIYYYFFTYSVLIPIITFTLFEITSRCVNSYYLLDMIDVLDSKLFKFITMYLSVIIGVSIYFSINYLLVMNSSNTYFYYTVYTWSSAFFLLNIIFLYILMKNYCDKFLLEIKNQSLNENIENITQINRELRALKHDFGNHLQVISGLLQLKKYSDSLNYIMNINKSASDTVSSRTGILSINALLNSKHLRARQKNIKLDVNISSHLDNSTFKIEDWEITKVLGNLIDNAIYEESKVSTVNKYIKVNIDELDDFYNFSVHNNNSYISTDKQKSIFSPGFSTKGADGSGMGLYIVKNIVNKYRGTIDLNSNIGKGTTFSVYFPKYDPNNADKNHLKSYPPQESALKAM